MKNGQDAVIVALGRSPIGDFGGSLAPVRAHELAAQVITAVLGRVDFDPTTLDDVILGDCVQCADEANTARTAMLKAGIPTSVPAVTIQRQCSSAMQALAYAAMQVRCGLGHAFLAGGVESMSNAPYLLPSARWGQRLKHGRMVDSVWELLYSGSTLLEPPGYIMGDTAERLAKKYGITRQEQDGIALRSHQNAARAQKEGRFKDEIVPISVSSRRGDITMKDVDEHVRPGLTMEDLARLRPVFATGGSVTAGNSSGLNDGAAICLVLSRARARDLGLEPLAVIREFAVVGCEPGLMGWGPVPATQKLLKQAKLGLKDIELIELNEAFAAQYLACEQGLGLDRELTNVNGSGVGLGHPVGATGARLVVTLVGEMKRRGAALGLATLCVGGGLGMAMLIENQ